ncbi:DedA family protein [Streptomyces cyanogenus]|uniref:Inner membrane protein YqjA n=1 Tax=Streptomyces cyanogenus TaxID=80860 RepID=A0ABX7TTF2_STRCY|nr:VTT domain-containing protein [Streptomyces cyanogenus]QTE00023.1 Inner membrane protein YqjA [Streptomyces cyanogenus]
MMTLALGPSWLDPNYLLDTYSIWGLLLIVFAESGLLIGFFLPGDSLLFTCGLLITSGDLDFPLWAAIALICLAAVLGDQAGYMFGKKVGPSLFNRPDSRLFKQENVTKAHEFFEKYGPKSLVLARFVPIVRTFTPIIAGVSGMKYRSFLIFNVIGGVLWGAGVTLLGSWLGNVPVVKNNIEAMLILIVLVSVIPIGFEFLRARGKNKKAEQTRPQPEPQPAHQQQYPQSRYQQPPVMDDATTRLRRIEPEQPPYQQPQQQDWNQQQGYGQYYDQQQYPQQQYPQQQYPQQQYDPNQPGQDQYGQGQYGQGQPGQDQPDPGQYGQNQYDPHQYPYDHRRQ